jgi:hypothetical protein
MKDHPVEISLQSLLYGFPRAGGWMPGAGKYSALLTTLLDSGTTLIEEALVPSGDGEAVEWVVRLTAKGMVERANGDQDPAPCAVKGWHTANPSPGGVEAADWRQELPSEGQESAVVRALARIRAYSQRDR